MNFLPLCTAIVWPTNSGRIVERRDHVGITFFSLAAFSLSILSSRCLSVNGPFFTEPPITYSQPRPRRLRPVRSLLFPSPVTGDELVGALVIARLEAACRLA